MDLHKKVIGNAVSAYLLFFVSVSFLWSKSTYINHPFVRSHTKTAFILHILLLLMFFVMSFNFLESVKILGYSINMILTTIAALFLFSCILYGASKAHRGETVTLGEIFHSNGMNKKILKHSTETRLGEEQNTILIISHIPFVGYILYGKNRTLTYIKDITFLNLLITLFSVLLLIFGYLSLASIIMLTYIVWAVFQSLRLTVQDEITTMDTSIIPTPEETYILEQALIKYVSNMFHKNRFLALSTIIQEKKEKRFETEKSNLALLKEKIPASIPTYIFYIPLVNIVGAFFLRTRDIYHIRNGFIISLLTIIMIWVWGWNSPLLLLIIFPISYGISYTSRKAYKMPYIYDIYELFACITYIITHIFHKTKELKKTVKKETTIFKIREDETPPIQ